MFIVVILVYGENLPKCPRDPGPAVPGPMARFPKILTKAILTYFRPRNPFPDSELSNSMSNYEIALGSPTFRVLGAFP